MENVKFEMHKAMHFKLHCHCYQNEHHNLKQFKNLKVHVQMIVSLMTKAILFHERTHYVLTRYEKKFQNYLVDLINKG